LWHPNITVFFLFLLPLLPVSRYKSNCWLAENGNVWGSGRFSIIALIPWKSYKFSFKNFLQNKWKFCIINLISPSVGKMRRGRGDGGGGGGWANSQYIVSTFSRLHSVFTRLQSRYIALTFCHFSGHTFGENRGRKRDGNTFWCAFASAMF
jgi:hypothetical protein